MAATPELEKAPVGTGIILACTECDLLTSTYCPSCLSEPPCCKKCFSMSHVTPKKKLHELKELTQKQTFNCPEHEEKLRLYCLLDNSLMCSVCCYGSHKGHEALPVADAVEKLRGEVTFSIESIIAARKEAVTQLEIHKKSVLTLKTQIQSLDISFEKLSLCLNENNPSLFLLSWVEATRLSGSITFPKSPSDLTSESDWKVLMSWLPPAKGKPELLYSTSLHGWNPSDFHRLCDGKGPTLTIMRSSDPNLRQEPRLATPIKIPGLSKPASKPAQKSTRTNTCRTTNYLFGGYNPISWNSSGAPSVFTPKEKDCDPFLFSLNKGPEPMRYVSTDYSCIAENHSELGPSFGRGDLRLNSFSNRKGCSCPRTYFLRSCSEFTDSCRIVLDQVDVVLWE